MKGQSITVHMQAALSGSSGAIFRSGRKPHRSSPLPFPEESFSGWCMNTSEHQADVVWSGHILHEHCVPAVSQIIKMRTIAAMS